MRGHAVYGPYAQLEPGRYAVEFAIAADGDAAPDAACATIDVTADYGQVTLASADITRAQLGPRLSYFDLSFEVATPASLEFRILSTGAIGLVAGEHRRLIRLEESLEATAALKTDRFPDPTEADRPRFFIDHVPFFRSLHDKGAKIRIVGDGVVVTIGDVSFHARTPDDCRFVDEVLLQKVYGIELAADTCVIDIGMNIGLASLLFASRAAVKEVHAFEPFEPTYRRACANLALNPDLARKITANCFGLAGHDAEPTVTFPYPDDSGRFSIFGEPGGSAHTIKVRDAADVLRPIITNARSRGWRVVAKIDCEGAEYAVFETLDAAGLLKEIAVIAIEWHENLRDKRQRDLIDPLLRHGFAILDMHGQGQHLFYAFNVAGA